MVTITDAQKVQGTFQAVDAKGQPTAPGGPLQVTVGDPAKLAFTIDDATHFTISAVGPVDAAGVGVQVTDGVATAQDSVIITGSAEASASIAFGAPVSQ